MSQHTTFEIGDKSKAQACPRSSPSLFQVASRVQGQTLKSSNIHWGSSPRPQNKLHPQCWCWADNRDWNKYKILCWPWRAL